MLQLNTGICYCIIAYINGFNSWSVIVNCYFNRTYRSISVGCNKQITQAQRGQGCLEEVFTILAVSISVLSYCMPTEAHIIKYV